MNPDLIEKLKYFSDLANKASGNHPYDQERFLDFVIEAHLDQLPIDEGEMMEWLISEGWEEESANFLVIKYSFGRNLLNRLGKKS